MKKHERPNCNKRRSNPVETERIVAMPATENELLDLLIGASKSTCPKTGKSPAYANEEQGNKIVQRPIDEYEEYRNSPYDDTSDYYVETNEAECINNISYVHDPYVYPHEYSNDTTAMTDVSQRGQIRYAADCDLLFAAMPTRCRYAIDAERHNNTTTINTIMALEAECAERKHAIDMEYRRRIYETMFEFNTQCRTHRDATNMCVIVDAIKQADK